MQLILVLAKKLLVIIILCTISVQVAFAAINNKPVPNTINTSFLLTHPLPIKGSPKATEIKKPLILKIANRLITSFVLKHKNAKRQSLIGNVLTVLVTALLILLLAFFVFVLAYGGASTGVLVLAGAIGLGLIIFGLAIVTKARRRKQRNTLSHSNAL